jgi:secondary thiamine-phosphate synthase enzyme
VSVVAPFVHLSYLLSWPLPTAGGPLVVRVQEEIIVIRELHIHSPGQGLHEITREVQAVVDEAGQTAGLCTVFVRHTSASLTIQENADPTARQDLEQWLNRLVPENDRLYRHTLEGADDMPAHIKSALTLTSVSIPVVDGRLALGTWQGLYLWEHRHAGGQRSIVVHIGA